VLYHHHHHHHHAVHCLLAWWFIALLLLLLIYTSPSPSYFQRWGLPCLNSEQLQLIGNKPPINGGFITGSAFALERLYFKAALIASQIGR
jgi:hypothetical protein